MNEVEIQNECDRLTKLMEVRGYTSCSANLKFAPNVQKQLHLTTAESMFPDNNYYLFIYADDCSTIFSKALAAVVNLPTDDERRALDLAQKMAAAREAAIAHGASLELVAMFEKLNEELWKNALPAPTPRANAFLDAADADEITF